MIFSKIIDNLGLVHPAVVVCLFTT